MKTLNIAHRGGAWLRPENTLSAFRHALEIGADGAELDVQLSQDGVAVVHHDYRLNPEFARKEGQWLAGPGPPIKAMSFAELGLMDIGRPAPGSDYARLHADLIPQDGERIPSLKELAATLPRSFLLLVELKSSTDPDSSDPIVLADAAFQAMKDRLARTIFVGFDWRGLARLKRTHPMARSWFTTDKLQGDAIAVLDLIKAAGGDGWFASHQDICPKTIAAARCRGLAVGAWTIDEAEEMRRLADLKLDAICTDRPDLLKSILGREAGPIS
ncbi:MAG: glycerophosphodiester phosphodiesterase family protein [Rhizomicrobium sp.]